jgi:hypothetical protein
MSADPLGKAFIEKSVVNEIINFVQFLGISQFFPIYTSKCFAQRGQTFFFFKPPVINGEFLNSQFPHRTPPTVNRTPYTVNANKKIKKACVPFCYTRTRDREGPKPLIGCTYGGPLDNRTTDQRWGGGGCFTTPPPLHPPPQPYKYIRPYSYMQIY